jgi:site-specific recombinase XerD
MARCPCDLGLKTSDVAQLKLDDIDWHRSIITLRPGKSRRCRCLPMPNTVQDALIDYLRNARPSTAARAVFVHHRAPKDEAVLPSTVRQAIRRAFARAGFPASASQVHRLRHTIATRLLESGNSLKMIADILGHQSLDTTTRYTYVDRSLLSVVALPWPGRLKP